MKIRLVFLIALFAGAAVALALPSSHPTSPDPVPVAVAP